MIESVEHVEPELDLLALFDGELLLNSDIPVVVVWRPQIGEVSRNVAEGPLCRRLERRAGQAWGRVVEPFGAGLVRDLHLPTTSTFCPAPK